MANSIIMPKTGMAMEEGVIIEWRIKEGDTVSKGDVVALIETDKSTMELESDYDGVILAVLGKAGETVPVTNVIAWVGKPGEVIPAALAAAPGGVSPAVPAAMTVPAVPAAPGGAFPAAADGNIRATPAARILAHEKGLALESICPGGKYGEIRRADVEAAAGSAPAATPLARKVADNAGLSLGGIRGSGLRGKILRDDVAAVLERTGPAGKVRPDTRVALTTIQKITGRRMTESRQTIPEVTEDTKVNVTRLFALRQELNEALVTAGKGTKVTVNDFVLAAAVKALEAHPRINSVLDGNELIYKGSINLGFAAATDRGLLVPVIRDAQALGFLEISAKAAALASRAREGKLSPDEMSGGTFTVSNVGMYGITSFTPIINPPEAAILGVCAVVDELALEGEKVVNHKKMGLSLAFDHRIVDGAESALFLKTLRELLEAPLLLVSS